MPTLNSAVPGAAVASQTQAMASQTQLSQTQAHLRKAPAVSRPGVHHRWNEMKAAPRPNQEHDSDKANQKALAGGTNCSAADVEGIAASKPQKALRTVAEQPRILTSSQRKDSTEIQAGMSQRVGGRVEIDCQLSGKRLPDAANLDDPARGERSSLPPSKRACEGPVWQNCEGSGEHPVEPAPAGSSSSEVEGTMAGDSDALLSGVGCAGDTSVPSKSETAPKGLKSLPHMTPIQMKAEHGSDKLEPSSDPGPICPGIQANSLAEGALVLAPSSPVLCKSGQQPSNPRLKTGVRTRGGSTVTVSEPISQDYVSTDEVAGWHPSSANTAQQDSNSDLVAGTADKVISGRSVGSQDLSIQPAGPQDTVAVMQLSSIAAHHPMVSETIEASAVVSESSEALMTVQGNERYDMLEPGEVLEQTHPKELGQGSLVAISEQLEGSCRNSTSDTISGAFRPVAVSTNQTSGSSDEGGCSKNANLSTLERPATAKDKSACCGSGREGAMNATVSSGAAHTSQCAMPRMEAEKQSMTARSAGSGGPEALQPVEKLGCTSERNDYTGYAFATMYCADWKLRRLRSGARTYCTNVISGFVLEADFLALQRRYLRLDSPYVFQRGDTAKLQDPEYAGRPTYDDGLQVSDDHLALFSGGGCGGFMGGKLARCLAAATADPARRPVPAAKAAEEGYNRSWQILLEARTTSTLRVANEARALAGAGRQKEAGQLWRLWTESRGGGADGPRGLPTVAGVVVSLCTTSGGSTRLHFVGAGDCRLALLRRAAPGGLFACQTLSPSAPGQRFGLERGARQCQPVVMQAPLEAGDVVLVGNAVFWARLAREESRVVPQLLTIVNLGGRREAIAMEIGRRLRAFVEGTAGQSGDMTLFVSVVARGACSLFSTRAHSDAAQSMSQPVLVPAGGGLQKDPRT